jgi:hypothetical protein
MRRQVAPPVCQARLPCRRNYYKFHTDRDWGVSTNYNLTLDSGVLGEDTCVEIILKAMED